jgi:hypothetical protein
MTRYRVDHTIKREPQKLMEMRIRLAAEDEQIDPNRQLQRKLRMGIDRLESQHLGKVWREVEYQDLPPGQVFQFRRTTHKSEATMQIQPKIHHAMRGSDGAMIISKGMDQGTMVYLKSDRIVLTKGN